MPKKFIITGGPGVGKTTTLRELKKKGFSVIRETSRSVIRQQNPNGILPWTHLGKFEELVIERQLIKEKRTEIKKGPVFLDRSLVDPIAYAELGGIKLNHGIEQLIKQANYARVFFLDQLSNYEVDKERIEPLEKAKALHEKLYEVYNRFGFDIVKVPDIDIGDRVELILSEIQNDSSREIEAKFRIDDLENIRKRIENYIVENQGTTREDNYVSDLFGLLKNNSYIRLRDNGAFELTIKGANRSKSILDRFELQRKIPSVVHSLLRRLLPKTAVYKKTREVYSPLGDSACSISLDDVDGLGTFVEIEASTENQILLWGNRLGISSEPIQEPYHVLVRK